MNFRFSFSFSLVAAAGLGLGACTMEPKYERPAQPVPTTFAVSEPSASANQAADLGWREFFSDPGLQHLIEIARCQFCDQPGGFAAHVAGEGRCDVFWAEECRGRRRAELCTLTWSICTIGCSSPA